MHEPMKQNYYFHISVISSFLRARLGDSGVESTKNAHSELEVPSLFPRKHYSHMTCIHAHLPTGCPFISKVGTAFYPSCVSQ